MEEREVDVVVKLPTMRCTSRLASGEKKGWIYGISKKEEEEKKKKKKKKKSKKGMKIPKADRDSERLESASTAGPLV